MCINLCGNQIRNKIIASIKIAGIFTIIADETEDVSCTEQEAICICYTIKEENKYTAQEDFITFVPTRDTTGETLSNIILIQTFQWGLDPANIVGQGYDGVGNMSGRTKGAQARISSLYPTAKYVHCKNHSLNLAIVHICKQRILATCFLLFVTCSISSQCLLNAFNYTWTALRPMDHVCNVCVKQGGLSMQSV